MGRSKRSRCDTLEDAALAIAAGACVSRRVARAADAQARSVTRTAGLTLLVTIAAAIVETYAVAHKSCPGVRDTVNMTLPAVVRDRTASARGGVRR